MQSKKFLALHELAYRTSAVIRPAESKTPFTYRIYGIAERTRWRRGRPETTPRRAGAAPSEMPRRHPRRREGGANGGGGLPIGVDEGRDGEGWPATGGGAGDRTKGHNDEAQGDIREKQCTASLRIQGGGGSPRTSGADAAACGSGAVGDDDAPDATVVTTVPAATHPPEGGRSGGGVTAIIEDDNAGGALASNGRGDPARWQNVKKLDGIGRELLHLSVDEDSDANGRRRRRLPDKEQRRGTERRRRERRRSGCRDRAQHGGEGSGGRGGGLQTLAAGAPAASG